MPTVNEKLHSDLIEHGLYLDRVSSNIRTVMVAEVDKTASDLRGLMSQLYEIESKGKLSKGYNEGMAALQKKIANVRAKGFESARVQSLIDCEKLTQVEADYIKGALERSIPAELGYSAKAVAGTAVKNIVAYGAFSGDDMGQWYQKWQVADLNRIMSTIKNDLAQGLTVHDVERHLFGTKASTYTDGILQGTRNDAERLARTVSNGVSNAARMEFYEANSDVVGSVMVSVAFDGRTCDYHLSIAGNVYKIDDPAKPTFPDHPNQRTFYSPVVDGMAVIGDKPSVGGRNFRKAAKEDYLKNAKAKGLSDKDARGKWNNLSSKYKNRLQNVQRENYAGEVFGSEPAGMSGDAWLRKQSVELQNDVLGVKKSKIFREKGLTLSEMMDGNRRKLMTVADLEKKSVVIPKIKPVAVPGKKYTSTNEVFKKVSYQGIDEGYAKDIDARFLDLENSYPINEGNINVSTAKAKSWIGHSLSQVTQRSHNGKDFLFYDDNIVLNKVLLQNKKTATATHLTNYRGRGSKLRSDLVTIDHEYGHQIDNHYNILKNPKLRTAVNKFRGGVEYNGEANLRNVHKKINNFVNHGSSKMSKEMFREMQADLGLSKAGMKSKIKSEFGSYAATSVDEFFAEGFATMRHLKEIEKTPFIKDFEKLFNKKFDEVIRNASN